MTLVSQALCRAVFGAALLGACSSAVPPGAAADPGGAAAGLKRVWMLVEWPGYHPERLAAARAQMDWRQLPQAGAHMGCNRLMFQVAADVAKGRLHIGPVAATRMYCAEHMDLELSFSGAIGSFNRYRLHGHTLVLENDQGQTVRWVAQDWD